MLDDNDIKKLKEVFATKNDLKQAFVTKDEFENFMEITATKDNIVDIKKDIKEVAKTLGKIDEKLVEANSLKHRVEHIETTLNIQPLKAS